MSDATLSTLKPARDWRPAFLAAFRNSANVRAAAQAAGVDWSTAYRARKREPHFSEAWDAAENEALDLLEARAMQLALGGDSHMLIFLLKTRRPEKFRDRVEVRVDVRNEAERIATHLGVDVGELLAEAERILAASS
jgi:hypothetical protein